MKKLIFILTMFGICTLFLGLSRYKTYNDIKEIKQIIQEIIIIQEGRSDNYGKKTN